MAKKRKYGVYEMLRKALTRDKILNAGSAATLLLDTFLERRSELKQAHVIEKGLCGKDDGSFSAWRQNLIDKGWLVYDKAYAQRTKRFSDHEPGPKLHEYLNRERIRRDGIATTQDIKDLRIENVALNEKIDLKADKSEVEALKARLQEVEGKMDFVMDTVVKQYLEDNPPHSEERERLLRANILDGKMFIGSDRPKNGGPRLDIVKN